jgi:hypothetical protein
LLKLNTLLSEFQRPLIQFQARIRGIDRIAARSIRLSLQNGKYGPRYKRGAQHGKTDHFKPKCYALSPLLLY